MQRRKRDERWSRRQFVAGVATVAASGLVRAQGRSKTVGAEGRDVYIVPHFHPASCGWLTTFSKERVYCANSYLSHLDRVAKDSQYAFVMSEVNNFIAVKNFRPERFDELRRRVREGRVEPVNAFFLESTISLSGGEALARMGAEGSRWYEQFFGIRPRHAWCIDTCGLHDQMAQIAHGLGLETLVYTRRNPTDKTIFWTEAPDGSRVLTLCPGSYTEASGIFESKTPLTVADLDKLEIQFAEKERMTPEGIGLLLLGSGGDYSVAPASARCTARLSSAAAARYTDERPGNSSTSSNVRPSVIGLSIVPASPNKIARTQTSAIKQRSPAGARWAGKRFHQIEKMHHRESSILRGIPIPVKPTATISREQQSRPENGCAPSCVAHSPRKEKPGLTHLSQPRC